MKVAHTADWHFRDKDLEECAKVAGYMVEKISREGLDVIIVAGDLSDSQDIKAGSAAEHLIVKTVSALADIAPVAIIRGTPSHEGNALEILRFARGTYPIWVATMPEQVMLCGGHFIKMTGETDPRASVFADPGAIITLIPQPTKQFFRTTAGVADSDQEIGEAMSGLFSGFGAQAAGYAGVPHILVFHGCISGGKASNNQAMTGRDIEISRDQLAMSGANLILCGHLHLPQELPGNIFYSGSIYANNIGEDHKHGFYIHEGFIDQFGTFDKWNWFIETPCKRIARYKFDMTAGEKITIPFEGIAGATVRVEVTAYQDETGQVSKETIIENLKRWGAESVDVRINAIPRENVRAESVLKADTLRDEIQAMAELRGEEIEADVLLKAELLEGVPGEELLQRVAGGVA